MILRDFSPDELKGMTAAQAKAAVNQHVQEFSKECGDPAKCWATVRDSMPLLYGAAFQRPGASTDGANTALPNGAPPPSVPLFAPMMGLPANMDKTAFNVAWYANSSRATPTDKPAIRAALVGHYIASKKMTEKQADKAVSDDFPALNASAQ